MKNILMSLVLLGTFAAMSAKGDSFLYWMTDLSNTGNLYKDANTALLIAKNDSQDAVIGAALIGDYQGESGLYHGTQRMASESIANMGDGWSFYVELYNGENWVGQSAADMSYVAAYKAGAIYQSLDPNGLAQVTFTSFTNVPEPTSGVLMLLGLCGLALRRKRA